MVSGDPKQAPAPAPITRTPCALRLKVRFTLMLRHLARLAISRGATHLCVDWARAERNEHGTIVVGLAWRENEHVVCKVGSSKRPAIVSRR